MNKRIIFDASGSMNEEGKASVIKSILFVVDRFISDNQSSDKYEVILLNEDISVYDPKHPVKFKGSISASKFKELLEINDTDFLIVTDGNLSEEVIRMLEKIENKIKSALLVGADVNKAKLRKVLDVDKLYETTDLITCLLNL